MASIQPVYGYPGLRIGYTAAEPLIGGQLVERRAGVNLIGVAAAGSARCVGVALDDIPATPAWVGGPSVSDPQGGQAPTFTRGVVPSVLFVAAAVEGQTLQAAAGGGVTPFVAGGDPSLIVGRAFTATAAGARGSIYIAPLGV